MPGVADLPGSVAFYSALLGTGPHKQRPGYANFVVSDPPLKLVLIETDADVRGSGAAGALNHLGIEVATGGEVRAAGARLASEGLAVEHEHGTVCCYARQDKVWVHDPAGAPWEVYTVTDDDPLTITATLPGASAAAQPEVVCC